MKLPIIETRKCKMCGCEYGITAQQKNKVYCNSCKEIARKEYNKKYQDSEKYRKGMRDRYHKRHKEETHFNICVFCGEEFLAKQGVAKFCIPCLEKKAKESSYYRNILDRRAV